ncbi:MAG: branched-chain amino acid ABC transporter permease, partial [Rhodospirillales bacterium]
MKPMVKLDRTAWLIVLFAVGAAILPWLIASGFWLNFVVMILFLALLGQAWNVLGGYGGQFSFGHAAFFGTGAYIAAVLQVQFGLNPWLCFVLAGLGGGLVGAFIGFLSFRYGLRGSYFALVTLAFAEVLRILANSFSFTGGGVGSLIPLKQTALNFQFADKRGFYYVALVLVIGGLILTRWLENSRFGARLMAVRENEDAARALGVNAFAVKLQAIVLSGAMAGLAGAFYAQYFLYVDPHVAYGSGISVETLLVPIIGGIGTVFGPILGAVVLQAAGEIAKQAMGDAIGLNLVLYGVMLIVMVLFLP